MPNIDWTKPIETVPCARNPVPAPCTRRLARNGQYEVRIEGDWFSYWDDNYGRISWLQYDSNGTATEWLPTVRNVVEPQVQPAAVVNNVESSATLRDQFAMAALTGMLADPTSSLGAEAMAEDAYAFADAMLKARES